MRRYLLAAGTLLGTLFVATAAASAGLGAVAHVTGPWHLSPRVAAHVAATQEVSATSSTQLSVQLLLVPQSMTGMLRQGVTAEFTGNETANGIASVSITRAAAKQAGLSSGKATSVVVGKGTVSQIKDGTVTLRMKFSRAVVSKLDRLQHLVLTLRVRLVAASGQHVSLEAVGRY